MFFNIWTTGYYRLGNQWRYFFTGSKRESKGTSATAVTDNSGRFSINASPTATLVFSSVGYAGQEVPVNNRTTIQVSLTATSQRLNEVVVTGYTRQSRKDITSLLSRG